MADTLEPLLMQRFLHETQEQIIKVPRDIGTETNLPISAEIEDASKTIYNKYEEFREQIRQGTLGKTAKF